MPSIPISIEDAGHNFPLCHGFEPVQMDSESGAVVMGRNEQTAQGCDDLVSLHFGIDIIGVFAQFSNYWRLFEKSVPDPFTGKQKWPDRIKPVGPFHWVEKMGKTSLSSFERCLRSTPPSAI
jgi:hypothetical protein